MKNRLVGFALALVVGLVSLGCTSCGSVAPNPKSLVQSKHAREYLENSVVAFTLVTTSGRASMPYCTGFWISPTKLATAEHCVQVADEYVILDLPGGGALEMVNPDASDSAVGTKMSFFQWKDHRKIMDGEEQPGYLSEVILEATCVAASIEHDVAVLELNEPNYRSKYHLPLAKKLSARGDDVYGVSMPMSELWYVFAGTLGAVYKFPTGKVRLLHDATMGPGSSGSALVNEEGRVIGVNTQMNTVTNVIKAMGVNHLKDLLNALEAEQARIDESRDCNENSCSL